MIVAQWLYYSRKHSIGTNVKKSFGYYKNVLLEKQKTLLEDCIAPILYSLYLPHLYPKLIKKYLVER